MEKFTQTTVTVTANLFGFKSQNFKPKVVLVALKKGV